MIVNSHATFRWKHGLFAAFDFDQLALFKADLYVTLLDNVETVHQRLGLNHGVEHSLKDLMVRREEEILATDLLSRANSDYPGKSRGTDPASPTAVGRVMVTAPVVCAYRRKIGGRQAGAGGPDNVCSSKRSPYKKG